MTVHLKLPSQILEAQTKALKEENIKAKNLRGMDKDFEVRPDGTRCIKNQSWLPLFGNLRDLIIHESYKSKYSIHLEIPTWKWERITMDFITKLPKTSNGHDTDMGTIVDRLTKSAHFIPIRETDSGLSMQSALVLNRHEYDIITPKLNGQKFSYNNSYHASIKAAPFEALYGRKCRSPVCWAEVRDVQITGPEIIHKTTEKIVQIRQRLQAARDRQRSYANVRRKPLEY
ncbi:putative reverse transcriptase domain-containing protein [Tanacetum coccineum]